MRQKERILIISSVPITHFGNLGLDRVIAFEKLGYEVDYLTKYKDRDPHVIGVYQPRYIHILLKSIKNLLPQKIVTILRKLCPYLFPKNNNLKAIGIEIKSPNEEKPIVDNETLLSCIKHKYKFVYISAWQDMITSSSIKAIYDKLGVPILIVPVDFQPFTGGCFYPRECHNFEKGCGNCPVLGGDDKEDFTSHNFQIKKENYGSINCGFSVNPYTMDFLKKAKIISDERILLSYYSMNETIYKPLDPQECRDLYDICKKKKYVIFSRFSSLDNPRKGCQYLPSVINSFAEQIGEKKDEVLLILAGGQDEAFEKKFNVDVKNVGVLNIKQLVQAYSAADIFISCSVDDAGPSMVNQSIMCGTPVLAFNIGSALYMIENGETGYQVPLRDIGAMSDALVEHFSLSFKDKQIIKDKCRVKGLETGSIEKSAKMHVEFAEKLSKMKI